jgi:hypothetical protein
MRWAEDIVTMGGGGEGISYITVVEDSVRIIPLDMHEERYYHNT